MFGRESAETAPDISGIVDALGHKEDTFREAWRTDVRYIQNRLPRKAEGWLQDVVSTAGVLSGFVDIPNSAPNNWVSKGKKLVESNVPVPGDFS